MTEAGADGSGRIAPGDPPLRRPLRPPVRVARVEPAEVQPAPTAVLEQRVLALSHAMVASHAVLLDRLGEQSQRSETALAGISTALAEQRAAIDELSAAVRALHELQTAKEDAPPAGTAAKVDALLSGLAAGVAQFAERRRRPRPPA